MGRDRSASSATRRTLSARSLRLLQWVGPLVLGNLALIFLLNSPRDGIHCTMVLPKEARESNSVASSSANNALLSWSEGRGLLLSPSVGVAMLPDISYSGSEHARSDMRRRQEAESNQQQQVKTTSSGKVTAEVDGVGDATSATSTSSKKRRSRADLNEHGWGLGWGSKRPQVRGLMAKRPMAVGDTVCVLPLSLALRPHAGGKENRTVLPVDPAQVVTSGGERFPRLADDVEALALTLLQEKALGSKSAWAQYITTLPVSVPLPIMLPIEDLEQIQWAWTQQRTRIMQREIQGSLHHITQSGALNPIPTFLEFRWAASIIHSRAFRIPFGSSKGRDDTELVLMPFMDVINHHYENHINWMEKPISENNTLQMVLKRSASAGQQIFTSFGPRSNDDLFMYYGFILDGNPFDSLAIFKSLQDAAKWLLDSLSTECANKALIGNPGAGAPRVNITEVCPRVKWDVLLERTKAASESSASAEGMEKESEAWQALLAKWGELGYEYLPYRPGPNVKPGGVVDPALLSVFAATLSLWNASLPLSLFPGCPEAAKKAGRKVGAEESVLPLTSQCCRDVSNQLVCPGAPDIEKAATADFIRLAIVRRCRQILVSLPTSVSEDRKFLRDIALKSADGSGAGCTKGQRKITDTFLLSVKYRLQKKEMLLEVIHRYSPM